MIETMALSVDIKKELKQLIESESDNSILEAIRTLLKKTSLDSNLKEKLINRALRSEEDIVSGRLFSKEDIIKGTDDLLTK